MLLRDCDVMLVLQSVGERALQQGLGALVLALFVEAQSIDEGSLGGLFVQARDADRRAVAAAVAAAVRKPRSR